MEKNEQTAINKIGSYDFGRGCPKCQEGRAVGDFNTKTCR